jgi:hypothetical protein
VGNKADVAGDEVVDLSEAMEWGMQHNDELLLTSTL